MSDATQAGAGSTSAARELARRHRIKWWEPLPWIAAIAVFFLFPNYLGFATLVLVAILFALSLDLVLGYAGIVTLGHAAFFGAGAYTVGILAAEGVTSLWLAWPAAVAVAAIAALFIGAVSLRTRGVYFIMITLAFAQMVYYLFVSLKTYGGEDGLALRARSDPGFGLSLSGGTMRPMVTFSFWPTV